MDPTTPSFSSAGHEFGAGENAVIGNTATWVTRWAWIAIIGGALLIVGGVFSLGSGGISQVVMGGIYLLVGSYFRGAGRSMNQVVETSGNDVSHLMEALDRLTAAFRVQVILVVIGVALSLLAIVWAALRGGGAG